MFAYADTVYASRPGKNRYRIELRRAAGCKVAQLCVTKGAGRRGERRYRRDIEAALTELRSMGVGMAIASQGFEGAELFKSFGISEPDASLVFNRCVPTLAGSLALKISAEQHRRGLCAAVLTTHASTQARQIVSALTPYTARLFVSGYGCEEYCDGLLANYGVAAQAGAPPALLRQADLIVCIKPWKSDFVPSRKAVLLLAGECNNEPECRCVDGVRLPSTPDAPPPEGVDSEQWCNALFLSGAYDNFHAASPMPTWKGANVL